VKSLRSTYSICVVADVTVLQQHGKIGDDS